MAPKLNENTLAEQPVINWLKELGYDYEFGPDLAPGGIKAEREFKDVVLKERLKRSLKRLNPDLHDSALEQAMRALLSFEHPNLEMANKEVYRMLTRGIAVEVGDGKEARGRIVKVFDFENPFNNEFLAVNQFAIQGIDKVRRPDVVIFVNGIPVAMFELKSPTTESGTMRSAYEQLQNDYKRDIPDIFKYNQVLVVSDLFAARHGTVSSSWEWFSVWRCIEGENEKHDGVSELEILTRGIFHKARLLDIIQNFIVFEADSERDATKFTKKMCLYHQYYGVNRAVEETLRAAGPKGNKKIGVFWHTQGSGKSLSMVFYVNKTARLLPLNSPTYVFLTDRNDLDGQFYRLFLRTGYANLAKQAESISDLEKKLREAGGELIFTTIQKFADEEFDKLSDRENIIVIADEAHRSQYAKFAGNVRVALPNASFMGITGTPVSLQDRDTRLVFGDHISVYPIDRSVEDGATVRIYYEGRLVPLHLANAFIDEEFEDLMAETGFEMKETLKRKWAQFEQAVGAEDRLKQVAGDIVKHFNGRGVEGKGMVVTMSRRIAVKMYELISGLPEAPEVAVVISKPEEFVGKMQKELNVRVLEKRFKDPSDSLKMVIVCDMWLTGFDVPPLRTMYIDKPLKNHTLMQAIARVNRVFKDKPGGLIVDYIGIADDLKRALKIYSSDIQEEAMAPIEEIIVKMMEKYDIVKSMLSGVEHKEWKKKEGVELAQIFQAAVNAVITDPKTGVIDESRKKRFLEESGKLLQLFAFAMPHHEAVVIRHDVEFFKAIRGALIKRMGPISEPGGVDIGVESTIKELISRAIAAEGVIDIFAMGGKGSPDISIFDEKFLEELKKMKLRNVAIETLRKLLRDEIILRRRKNEIRYRSLAELLDAIIEEYENRIIDSSRVIEQLIGLAKKIKSLDEESRAIGLTEEELAFYDVISDGKRAIENDKKAKELVKELARMIKRDLTVDWTNNERIQSSIRANVRRLLLRNEVSFEQSEIIVEQIYQQAISLYRDFVPAGF